MAESVEVRPSDIEVTHSKLQIQVVQLASKSESKPPKNIHSQVRGLGIENFRKLWPVSSNTALPSGKQYTEAPKGGKAFC